MVVGTNNELVFGLKKLAYSLKEAADLIGVTAQHLRNEQRRGKLQFVKSGRRVLIMETDLRSYLEQNVVKREY